VKLAASLIVRNELSRFLEPCIESLLEFVDEIRVLDDHSDDGSWEWLLNRAGVQPLKVGGSAAFFAHEGRARQTLLEWTLEGDPTHVLAVDADELVSDGAAVRRVCEESPADVFSLDMLEVWNAQSDCLCVRGDGGWRPHPVHALWRVPADRSRLHVADRALACGRVPQIVDQAKALPTGARILHFGWANETERVARHHRYTVADGGRFHQSQHLDSILWPDERVGLHPFGWPSAIVPHRHLILERCNPKGT